MNKTISLSSVAYLIASFGISVFADTVIVASSKSASPNLSKEQVSDIYHGKLKELPGLGPVVPIMQGSGPATDEFLAKVLGKSDAAMKAHWAKLTFTGKGSAPKEVANGADMKKLLASNPSLIGYVDKGEVDASLKTLTP